MTNHLVEGRLLPDAVAGHPALELCNTMAMWGLPSEREYLRDFPTLVLWARECEVVTAGEAVRLRGALLTAGQQATALRAVRRLRSALYQAATAGAPLDDIHAAVARAVRRSAYTTGSRTQQLRAPLGPTVLLDRLALEAHRLLVDHGIGAVRLCAAPVCGWVFLDPAHRRRWCVMAGCGNRAKARRFAERRRRAQAPATTARTD